MRAKAPKILKYAAIGLLLSPFMAGVAKGQSLEGRVNKATAGRSVRVTVKDDFSKLPLADAWVRFVNRNNPSIIYSDSTNSSGVVQWNDFYTDVKDDNTSVPTGFKLKQNYPNPFNPSTRIPLSIDHYCDVNLSIYNIRGELVKTLYDGKLTPGEHEYTWNGTDKNDEGVAAGQYIVVFRSKDNQKTIKMMLLDGNVSVAGGSAPWLAKTALNPGEWYDVNVSKYNYPDFNGAELIEEGSGIQDIIIEMTRNNGAPVPIATVTPLQPRVGQPVTFDDLGSYDPENDPFTYKWNTEGATYTTPDAQHIYSTPGNKTVTFTVTDERGAARDTSFTLNVLDLEKITKGWVTDITNDSLLAGQPVTIAGITDTTDATGNFSIAGLKPGTYRIRVGTGTDYLTMERNVTVSDIDTTRVGPQRLVPNEPGLVEFLNGTVFLEKPSSPGRFTQKWTQKSNPYVNTDNVGVQSQSNIQTFLTDPKLAESTYGLHSYTAQDIHKVPQSELPAYGADGTFLFDNLGSKFAAIYENPNNRGIINAVVISLTDGAGLRGTYHEGLTGVTGIDEVDYSLNNKYETARNDPSNLDHMSEKDVVVNKFNQDRDPNTLPGDIGSQGQSLGKSSMPGGPIIVVDGQVIGDRDLTHSQISAYHTLLERSNGRMPKYVIFN